MSKKKKNDIIEDEISTANILGIEPIQDDNYEEEPQSNKEMVIERALDHLMDPKDMDVKSNIKQNQVIPYTRLLIFGEHYQVPIAKTIVNQALRLNVSIDALSRKGFTDIVRSVPPEYPELENEGSMLSHLINGNKVHK